MKWNEKLLLLRVIIRYEFEFFPRYDFELLLTCPNGNLYSQKIGLKFKKYFLNCFSLYQKKKSLSFAGLSLLNF